MQNFINTFGDICEFTFIEGPQVASESPIKYFVRKGIKPPYKAWGRMTTTPYKTLQDGKTELNVTRAVVNYEGIQESVMLMIEHMN